MASRVDFDIAIVGAGPAGASTALFLHQYAPALRGRILVIDRATFPRDKVCAGAIAGRADKLLATIGVRITTPSAWVWGLRAETSNGVVQRQADNPIGRVVRRREFDAALAAEAVARGIALRQGVKLTGFRVTAAGVTLATSAGELRVKALVGADGVGSVVRRGLALAPRLVYAQAIEVDTPWVNGDAPGDVLSFDLLDRGYPGYAWDFPTLVNGRSMVCRGIYRVTRGLAGVEDSAANIDRLLRERLQRQGIEQHGKVRRFAERGLPLHALTARERVLLVGDAAGVDAVLGEGIAQAIFYGEASARYLAKCVANNDFRFGDYRTFISRQRLGTDLRLRALGLPLVYGTTRPQLERWLTNSAALTDAGMAYFAGSHVPRGKLLRAATDLFASLVKPRERAVR